MIKKNDIPFKASDNEQFCKEVFHSYLKNHLINFDARWETYPRGRCSPPDFNMILNNQIYAVEITDTKIIQEFRGDQVNERTFCSSRENFIKEVKSEALRLGILRGTYHVFFLMKWTIPLTRKLKEYLKKQLLQYIDKSKDKKYSASLNIKYEYRNVCQISKTGTRNKIYTSFGDAVWSKSPENQNFICNLLQYAITTKKGSLEKEGVPPPRILLLRNTYPFATSTMYTNFVPDIQYLNFFHSIFIIMSPNNGFFLYTRDEEWKRLFNIQ
jgi:hypothetical protein